MSAEILSFETGRPAELADNEPSLVVDVEGYEGPLDLLLALARQQKVDLHKISILALADQYLVFIEAAREAPVLSGKALDRAKRALASRKPPQPLDRAAARAELDELIGRAGVGA